MSSISGALLVHKEEGISSFGVIEKLQKIWMEKHQVKKREVPKLGHGGTLDPFATGLLIVCVGPAVKLARYFLGSGKGYEGLIRFGETTIPGDPTSPVSERSEVIPHSMDEIQSLATQFTLAPYHQTPPMHSAKKRDGKPLYELAREGIEVEREAKTCSLYSFEITDYTAPRATFRLSCSSGTYVRTLTQDLGKKAGSVALLEKLNRTASGCFNLSQALTLHQIQEATQTQKTWDQLDCWIPFDRLLDGYDRAEATPEEVISLTQGKQEVLRTILKKGIQPPLHSPKIPVTEEHHDRVAIYCGPQLVAMAHHTQTVWTLERVFLTHV